MQLRFDRMRTGRNGGWRRERFKSVTDVFPQRDVNACHWPDECNGDFAAIVIFAFNVETGKTENRVYVTWG